MQWPASEVDIWAAFFAKEPPPEDQQLFAFARLTAFYVNVHKNPNAPEHPVMDFLPFRNAWAEETQDEAEVSFKSITKMFGAVERKR